MTTTVKALKDILEVLQKGDLLCEVVAVSMLSDLIRVEEAKPPTNVRYVACG